MRSEGNMGNKKKDGGGSGDWKDNIPPWLSVKTYRIAAALKVRAQEKGVDIGIPMRAQRNGDAMWYVLTDGTRQNVELEGKEKVVQHLSVLLCTPHCILIEDNYRGVDVEFSILSDPDIYLEHLYNSGMRALTDEEVKKFLDGTL